VCGVCHRGSPFGSDVFAVVVVVVDDNVDGVFFCWRELR